MKKLVVIILTLMLLPCCVSLVACGDGEKQGETAGATPTSQPTPTAMAEATAKPPIAATATAGQSATPASTGEGHLPWDDIPVYPGAELELSEECPPQWQQCETCERRVYTTDASPEGVCEFYKNEMPKRGWDKIVYQFWPEGSCTGTWMAEMGDDSGPRVLLGIGQRSRTDETTSIGVTMGVGCP